MSPWRMSVTFLGTCSGGGPLLYRACTATALNLANQSWLVDCAEGTQVQLQRARFPKLPRVSKIFITHLHIDHCMGLLPLMNSAMRSTGFNAEDAVRLELYGPAGLRKLVRMNLELTRPNLTGKYRTHELLTRDDPTTSCEPGDLYAHELDGRDIRCDEKGQWTDFVFSDDVWVDAGPIAHRVPCLGYVFREVPRRSPDENYLNKLSSLPRDSLPDGITDPHEMLRMLTRGRPITLKDGIVLQPPDFDPNPAKVVILGDTSDPSGVEGLAQNATLLVHESTNAFLPLRLDLRAGSRTPESVREKAISRGHSTPDMAGAFARRINAQQLYMNHFSVRFPDAGPPIHPSKAAGNPELSAERDQRAAVLTEIERQASEAWGLGQAVCARDLLVVDAVPNGLRNSIL